MPDLGVELNGVSHPGQQIGRPPGITGQKGVGPFGKDLKVETAPSFLFPNVDSRVLNHHIHGTIPRQMDGRQAFRHGRPLSDRAR